MKLKPILHKSTPNNDEITRAGLWLVNRFQTMFKIHCVSAVNWLT